MKLLGLKSQTLASERDQLREARPALLQRAAQLRLELEDAEARVASDSSAASGREKELREVESKIAAAEKSLAALDAKLAKARRLLSAARVFSLTCCCCCKKAVAQEESGAASLRQMQTRLDELLQREARGAQFKSKKVCCLFCFWRAVL